MGLNEKRYGAMPAVEQTLASDLSPSSASFLKAPKFPTKPLKQTFGLVWKAYTVAGQAGLCLHTMAVLQAYQANLLKDLDEKKGKESDVVAELCLATDLLFQATKETWVVTLLR
ncbi:Glycerol kinase [Labeo rohita]|uniref:Glycerol kinase n=1 Tax=Labeo rohita TaxID=84645 RepID=A0ABQ8LYF4_LABRO|nr:Glycerol kinase [Labeo rohita]